MKQHSLVIEAERLLYMKGRVALDYLKTLLQIKLTPSIWKKKYGSFREFCRQTGHGPESHVTLFEQVDSLLEAYDKGLFERGQVRTPTTLEAIGFDAARQLLKLNKEDLPRVIEALYNAARGVGHVLTYQAAVNIIYQVLGLRKQPSKTVRGKKLGDLRNDAKRLIGWVMDLQALVAWLRKRIEQQEAVIHRMSERLESEGIDHKDLWPDHPLGDEDLMNTFEARRSDEAA